MLELEIDKLDHNGCGIAYHDNKICFVENALTGEVIKAVYLKKNRKFLRLLAKEIIVASAERIAAKCPHYDFCGGCKLQHWQHEKQIAYKQQVLIEQLKNTVNIEIEEILPALQAQAFNYRHKARIAVKYDNKKQELLVGFREKNPRFITKMNSCEVLHTNIAKKLPQIKELLISLSNKHQIPQLEMAVADDKSVIVIRHLQDFSIQDLQLIKEFSQQQQLAIYGQSSNYDSVKVLANINNDFLLELQLPEHDIVLKFHPLDFTQINFAMNRLMLSQALQLLELNKQTTVLDLFCGIGNFSLVMARYCKQVIAVEGCEKMVQRAISNAKLNNLTNTTFYAADLTKNIDDAVWYQKNDYDCILLDPPRSGAKELIPQIVRLAVKKILYVSCDRATFIRDAEMLTQQQYKLVTLGIMDMFPHTAHMEIMALFVRI